MAGYSGTPLVKKLGYRPNFRALLRSQPPNYLELIAPLPEGVIFLNEQEAKELDLIHFFSADQEALAQALPVLMRQIRAEGCIWVSWPKKASKLPSTISEDLIREWALPLGLVDIKVCALDETWSGLKLVIRKELRKAKP